MENRSEGQIECRMVKKDITYITVQLNISLIQDEVNHSNRILCIARDICDRVIAEVTLMEKDLLQKQLLQASNARDAMDNSCEKKIIITTEKSGSIAIILFDDTGTGIEEEVVKMIFDPFFTTKDVGKGTGLGLSIVREIIEEHSGSIKVENRKDARWTRFVISLPIDEL